MIIIIVKVEVVIVLGHITCYIAAFCCIVTFYYIVAFYYIAAFC